MTKKVRRRKFNFLKFATFLLFLFLICFSIYSLLNVKIRHIIVKGTQYLEDVHIIETAGIDNYPSYFKVFNRKIEEKIKDIDIVKNVKVNKKWGYIIEINITEKKILFIERSTGKYILEDGSEEDLVNITGTPVLINYVVDDIKEKLITKFSEINYDVLTKISEIEYTPTSYDEERFLLYMNDGNAVYITLNKIDEFKKYIEIKKQLGGKKGILYLDSGNYFEIKE